MSLFLNIKLIFCHINNGDFMNFEEAFNIIPRSIMSIIVLFFITKLMGKKQASELSLFDYIIGISIGNFSAEMVMNLDYQYINGVIAVITFGLVSCFVSHITAKSIILRRFLIGEPTIIINDGKISYSALIKSKLDINDLLEQCRNAGYFDVSQISYAVLEVDGKLSILPKIDYQVPKLSDLNIKGEKSVLSSNLIIDGSIMINNLKNSNKTITWLNKELKKKGYSNYKKILLATLTNNKLTIFEKDNGKIDNILE